MSMFRRPGDSSSSSSEASYDQTGEDELKESQPDSLVTRVNTLESSTSEMPVNPQRPSLADMRGFSTQDIQALGFHAMLEQNAITAAAARLGIDPSDAEAQRQGREAYQRIARQLPEGIDGKYASDEFRALRTTMQEGINQTTSAHLNTIAAAPDTHALIMRHRNGSAAPTSQPPRPGFNTLSDLPTLPDSWLRRYPDLQNDRYARDFSELEIVGKGGYGKVFKVKHKLDGSFYAVKRIAVPAVKLEKVQQHGPEALNSMLEEVRSLAKFDHANIVRYHNAWLEFATVQEDAPPTPTTTCLPNNRLLEEKANLSSSPSDVGHLQAEFDNIEFGEPSVDCGAGILFEASNTGETEDSRSNTDILSLHEKLRVRRRNRRTSQASQATIATISSTKSIMSAVEDVSEEEFDEEEVEMIQRRHMPFSQDLTTDLSDSMISHSDMPAGPLIRTRTTGPVLTLNVQMSLYESNLAAFLAPDRSSFSSKPDLTHCFHPCISLELLSNILAGVEYLHSQGVVHRDLKPANIFLALTTGRRSPYGAVDLASCKHCSQRECVYVVPRIGDFGLVAALEEPCAGSDAQHPAVATTSKPVGTEFYRPDASSRNSDKLDVFALGVIAVEMLWRFGTRMERSATLARLKKGEFPDGFADQVGLQGEKIKQLVGAMVMPDEQLRMGCEEARSEIGRLIEVLSGVKEVR